MSGTLAHGDGFVFIPRWRQGHIATTYAMTPWYYNVGPFPQPIDWSPPKGERIGGVPPWQGGRRLTTPDPGTTWCQTAAHAATTNPEGGRNEQNT